MQLPRFPLTRLLHALHRCTAAPALVRLQMPRHALTPSRASLRVCLVHSGALARPRPFHSLLSTPLSRSNFGTDSLGTGASQPRLAIAFTCGVCGTRNHKMFSRRSYEHGVVVIRCDGEPSLARAPAGPIPRLTRVCPAQAAARIT